MLWKIGSVVFPNLIKGINTKCFSKKFHWHNPEREVYILCWKFRRVTELSAYDKTCFKSSRLVLFCNWSLRKVLQLTWTISTSNTTKTHYYLEKLPLEYLHLEEIQKSHHLFHQLTSKLLQIGTEFSDSLVALRSPYRLLFSNTQPAVLQMKKNIVN